MRQGEGSCLDEEAATCRPQRADGGGETDTHLVTPSPAKRLKLHQDKLKASINISMQRECGL